MKRSISKAAVCGALSLAFSSCIHVGGHRSFCIADLWHLETPCAVDQGEVTVELISAEVRIESDGETRTIPLAPPRFTRPCEGFEVALERGRVPLAFQTRSRELDLVPVAMRSTNARVASPKTGAGAAAVLPVESVTIGPRDRDFYVTLGTGIADPEKEASWTSAAVYPIENEGHQDLPAMQIEGRTSRVEDSIQVMPGIFWWPNSDLQLSVAFPLGLSEAAPQWGVLFALTY